MVEVIVGLDAKLYAVLKEELDVLNISESEYVEWCVVQHLRQIGLWKGEHPFDGRLL